MADVTYHFRAIGADTVQASFKSIGDAAEASARRSQRAQTQQAKSVGGAKVSTAGKQAVTSLERDEKAKTRATEREANARAKAETTAAARALAHVKAIRERHFAMEQRQRDRTERAEVKSAEKRAAMEQRARAKASKERWGPLGSDVASFGKGIALSAGAGTAGLLGLATRDSMALQEKANRISINARGSGEAFQDPTAMRKSFEATAIATPGIKAIDVADAVQRYVSLTGDTKTAMASQGTFATAASATGTDIGDIAEAAASLSKQFDITGIDDMREALASLTAQGKAGAFELSDAAGQFQRLAAAGAAFGLDKGKVGARTLGGLTQIARSGTGSAEEATTSVTGMFAAFNSKQAELKKSGVNVFGKDGKRRGIQDLLVETIGKVGGTNAAKKAEGLNKIFGEQGGKAINPMLNTYNTAYQSATGTDSERQKAAMDALRASIVKATDAPGTWADVVKDAAQAQSSSSAQLTQAWEKVTATAGAELAPAMIKLVDSLSKSGAIDVAMDGLKILGGALAEVAGLLTELGLIKPKTKTLEEKKQDAAKALVAFDEKNGDPQLDAIRADMLEGPEQAAAKKRVAERGALTKDLEVADAAMWQGKASGDKTSQATFQARYARLGGGGIDKEVEAAGLARQYTDGERPNEFLLSSLGKENDEQRNYRRQYEGELTDRAAHGESAPTSVAQIGGMELASASMKEMAAAAKEAAAAFRNAKPTPSIIPGS